MQLLSGSKLLASFVTQKLMEQRLHMYGVLFVQFDAFSLLEFAVDWHFVSSAFRM